MAETNMTVREAAKKNGVFLWQIAERIGIADSAFSRKLRHEFSPEETARLLSIIEDIYNERKE